LRAHACGKSEEHGGQEQRQECVQPHGQDQEQQQSDGTYGKGNQVRTVCGHESALYSEWAYSWRKATVGSTLTARRAGGNCASRAIETNSSATAARVGGSVRSEEHTSELQSRGHLVCRLLLEKKKKQKNR